jgi:hypothetical protein
MKKNFSKCLTYKSIKSENNSHRALYIYKQILPLNIAVILTGMPFEVKRENSTYIIDTSM